MPTAIKTYHLSAAVDDATDVDELGITDPSFDRSLDIGEGENGLDGTDESIELEVGETIATIRSLGSDDSDRELDFDAGALVDEPENDEQSDDENGPANDSELNLEFGDTEDSIDSDDDEDAPSDYSLDTLPELDSDQSLSDDPEEYAQAENEEDVSDVAVLWAAQPWSELKLRSTYVARRSLNARRNILVAAGDAIDFLSLDDFEPIGKVQTSLRAAYASFLDNNCKSVLIVKATGQVVIWNCDTATFDLELSRQFSTLDQAVDACFDPSERIWIRTNDGRLLRATSSGFELAGIPDRCLAITLSYQTMLCLMSRASRLCLLSIPLNGEPEYRNPVGLAGLLPTPDVKLLAFEEIVVTGARGLGLWLSTDGGTSFRKTAGCRTVTAFTIGQYLGRSYVWAALFYELEDRAEVVSIDTKTARVQKVFEYRVITDSQGPEDDPPERARIDCLLWDSSRHRILAAGCFGLACFVPNPTSNSAC